MSTSRNQDQAMLDSAIALYNKKNRTHTETLQCEGIFLELLDDRARQYGEDSDQASYIHWYMGLLYSEMDSKFDEGEAHFLRAFELYNDDGHKASIASHHASLLVKKAELILEESEDLKEDARIKPGVSKVKRTALRAMIDAAKNGKPTFTEQDMQTLRDLAATNEEAMDCFRKSAQLRETAANLHAKVAEKAKEDKKKLQASQPAPVRKPKAAPIVYKTPREILAALELVAIGQGAAKRGLANAASMHLRRMALSPAERALTDKSNVMLLGPTGCGKTLLAEALAGVISVPFYKTEATKLTAAGYVGEDVQEILAGLLRNCDWDVARAENGIIYLDEIDKIASNGETSLDVGGESVQEELLTILEGTVVTVPKEGTKRQQNDTVDIDTTNIMFVLGGAFVRLGEIVAQRKADAGSKIGFGAEVKAKETEFSKFLGDATVEDFIKFGMIPEFMGRVPIKLVIEALTVDQLERILTEPTKALVKQKRLLLAPTTDLIFTKGALKAMAEAAHKTGTHGRALREIVEEVLEPVVFEEPAVAIITTEKVNNRKAEIKSQNAADRAVKPAASLDYVIDDEAVDGRLEEATAAAQVRAEANASRRVPVVVREAGSR